MQANLLDHLVVVADDDVSIVVKHDPLRLPVRDLLLDGLCGRYEITWSRADGLREGISLLGAVNRAAIERQFDEPQGLFLVQVLDLDRLDLVVGDGAELAGGQRNVPPPPPAALLSRVAERGVA